MSKATHWVRDNTGMLLLICLLTWGGLAIALARWAFDDAPPFAVKNYMVTPVPPGGTMLVVADVQRELGRDCSAVYSRRFVDSRGATHPIEADTSMSAKAIGEMNVRSPNKLIFTVPIPSDTPPGKGLIVTPLSYTCNPWHAMRPITMTLEMTAEVLTP